jgi:hypothetical protein
MAEDLKTEIQRHLDHLNKAEQARWRLLAKIEKCSDLMECARMRAQVEIEEDVWRAHWKWLFVRGIHFYHLDRVGPDWMPSPQIDLVELVEIERTAQAADRERLRIDASATISVASM